MELIMKITVNSLSHSTVNQYVQCPEQVWNDKILKQSKKGRSVNLVNGVALHAATETLFYSKFYKYDISPEILFKVFESTFNSLNGPDVIYGKQSVEEIFNNSKKLINFLYSTDLKENVIAVEKTMLIKSLSGLDIITKPDLVTQNPDTGDFTIWDVKSAAKNYTTDDLKRVCEQTMLYSLALAMPIKMKILLLLKKKQPEIQIIELNPYDLGISIDDILKKFTMVKKALETGIHFKNRSWACKTCSFSYLCNSAECTATDEMKEAA